MGRCENPPYRRLTSRRSQTFGKGIWPEAPPSPSISGLAEGSPVRQCCSLTAPMKHLLITLALILATAPLRSAAASGEPSGKDIHWAFIAPTRPAIPSIANRQSPIANPIDAFILARLATEKIKPSPEADRVTLIRRLSLDLTGLPPSIAEVEHFLNDRSADA